MTPAERLARLRAQRAEREALATMKFGPFIVPMPLRAQFILNGWVVRGGLGPEGAVHDLPDWWLEVIAGRHLSVEEQHRLQLTIQRAAGRLLLWEGAGDHGALWTARIGKAVVTIYLYRHDWSIRSKVSGRIRKPENELTPAQLVALILHRGGRRVRRCPACSTWFVQNDRRRLTCSPKCRQRVSRRRRREASQK